MMKQSFMRRIVVPPFFALAVTIVSINAYNASRCIEGRALHDAAAAAAAAGMVLGLWMGAFFVNALAYFRGADTRERILISLVTPLVWIASQLYDYIGLYPAAEILFLVFYPLYFQCIVTSLLNVWISTLVCDIISMKRGVPGIRIAKKSNIVTAGLFVVGIFFILKDNGNYVFYRFMDLYGLIFK